MKNTPLKKPKKQLPSKLSGIQEKDNTLYFIFFLLLLTFCAYLPVLKASFLIEWDDPDYVSNNLLIKNFSKIGELLTTPIQGNFHPLTMLSIAFNYTISGENAWSYHLLNVILHIANTYLVYKFSSRLSKENFIISFTTAMLFALHPMHVESVAWVAERKDVLYSFFFLLGLISYINYISSLSRKSYLFCIVWFSLSLLSKPSAVIFPVALFTIDLFYSRKFSLKLVTEKIPFFLFAAIIGYHRLYTQSNVGVTDSAENFLLAQRIFFMFYGFMMYFFKMLFPINLNAFYQNPLINHDLPIIYYLSPIFFLLVLILCILNRKKYNVIAFGFSFYFVNLFLVLNLFIMGSAILAERYTYIPYIGLFYIIGWAIDRWQKHNFKGAVMYLLPLSIVLAILTYNQAATWKNSKSLWEHAIKVNPNYQVYKNMAFIYFKEKNSDKEIECYNEALKFNVGDAELYCNRGNIYLKKRMFKEALIEYNTSLSVNPNFTKAIANRGSLFAMQGKYELALADFNKTINLSPELKLNFKNRALVYYKLEKYYEAIKDFYKFLEFEPDNMAILNSIGECYQALNQNDTAISVFNKVILIRPEANFYLNRSISWYALGNINEARKDAIKARESGGVLSESYAKTLGI